MNLLWELVRKDLRIFIADRKSVFISFLTPVLLACFIAFLMERSTQTDQPKRVSILFVDQDQSPVSKEILSRIQKGNQLSAVETTEAEATEKVKSGDAPVAVIVPKGFGAAAVSAMTTHAGAPSYRMLTDPSRNVEGQMATGALMRVTMQSVAKSAYGTDSDDSQMPFTIKREVEARDDAKSVGMAAHAFAGMAMQGLLFWAIESAMTLLKERRMGIWRRQRASPVTPSMFLIGKAISSMVRAIAILVVVFGFGIVFFGFRIPPTPQNYLGFALIAIGASLMTATFGLLVAALGRTEQQSRGLSILAVLGMCMIGGAWFPAFLMPEFIQSLGKAVPISWAIDGFDGMIWRGQGLSEALVCTGVLVAFSVAFWLFALRRLRWEPEAA